MKSAFSLVELSIVLVILGLLTGGILAGQSLIRASELRAVTTEYQRWVTAAQAFRDKYFALPGDISNATSFWGAAHATPATCLTTVGTGTQTCNGDGDGGFDDASAASRYGEKFTFWQHLANAGLIEGTYSGRASTGGVSHSVIGTNVPSSKLNSGGWYASEWNGGDGDFYTMNYGIFLTIGGNVANDAPRAAILKPEEAWNIDTKLDDGKPAQGKVIAIHWNNLCAAADDGGHATTDLVASYKLTDTAVRCGLAFRQAF